MPPAVGQVQVFVELMGVPAAVTYATELRKDGLSSSSSALRPQMARAASVARTQIQKNRAEQEAVAATLTGSTIGAREIYRATKAINGIAVLVDVSMLDAIRQLQGVKSVHILKPIERNSTPNQNITYINAPPVWNDSVGLGKNLTGAGIRVAVIDTGVDYLHANFGGRGALADYQAAAAATNGFTTPGNVFPTAKVIGGWDFAGDGYDAGGIYGYPSPAPDPNPMDCSGHGSHVAGTIAGFGVNADGSRYAGRYSPSTPFSSLLIPPGVAPDALLYSYRVFGCGGSTNLVVPAIDLAMDPNQDDDLADHVDVINMSLGSSYGTAEDPDAIASNNASLAGVAVAVAAGNSGDGYFLNGSPASADRAISVAASQDGGQRGGAVTVRAPAAIAGASYVAMTAEFGPTTTAAGVTGNVVRAVDATSPVNDGCQALTNAPAISGNIALVDRGLCTFKTKVLMAQNAGAIGVIVANVSSSTNFGGMADDPAITAAITIPSVLVEYAPARVDLLAHLSGLDVTLYSIVGAADTIAPFSSRGPRGGEPVKLKPEVTAPGVNVVSTQSGVTCDWITTGGCIVSSSSGFLPGNQALILSGTSMATPHVAGTLALLRQLHPQWTVEELKAELMNGALHDVTTVPNGGGIRYGAGRVGAGREDVALSAQAKVLAYSADDPGVISVSFGAEILGSGTVTRHVHLVNHGTASQTYQLAFDIPVAADGVSLSFPDGPSVTVPAGAAVDFPVQLTATASNMNHTRDPSVSSYQLSLPRHWLTEEAGTITFSQDSAVKLRVPVYSAPVPVSAMTGTFDNALTPTRVNLTGTDLCTGTLAAGPTCTGSFPNTVESLVTPFELHVVNPPNPKAPPSQNIQYAGAAYDSKNDLLLFGFSTWGDWSHPSAGTIAFFIDSNNDGVWDKVVYNATFIGSPDAPISVVADADFSSPVGWYPVNLAPANDSSVGDSRLFNTNVAFLSVPPSALGITGAFHYMVATDTETVPGPFRFDPRAQGFDFRDGWLSEDLNGQSIPVTCDASNVAANGALGALLLHHKNASGSRAQVVPLSGAASADIALAVGIAPANPAPGQNVTVTYTVTNRGPSAASGVVVKTFLPSPLQPVYDDASGAYDTNLGLWNVGSLDNGASRTFHLVVHVSIGSFTVTAQAGGTSPVDPNLSNNAAQATVTVSTYADLSASLTVLPTGSNAGASAAFKLVVTNNGPGAASNLTTVVTSPAISAVTATDGSFSDSTRTWSIPNLAAGSSATLTYIVVVSDLPLTSHVTVTSATADPNMANNSATATAFTGQSIPGLFLPVVLDNVAGVGGSEYRTELTLASKATTPVDVGLLYTASVGTGTGIVVVTLAPVETRVIPNALSFLRSQGLPIPTSGPAVGTLLVTFASPTSRPFVGGRTFTTGGTGSFGLFYPAAATSTATATLVGLQDSDTQRSNVALANAGGTPVTLRVQLLGPLGEDLGTLPDQSLPPYGWAQIDRPLAGKAASGRAVVTEISGSSPFTAYGVLNDAVTSDGSFIPPLIANGSGLGDRLVPIVLDAHGLGGSHYVTELTLANLTAGSLPVALVYTASLGSGSGQATLTLAPGEQKIVPDAIGFLRSKGLAIPDDGSGVGGSLLAVPPFGTPSWAFAAGARTFTPASTGGSFGLYTPGLTLGESAASVAYVNGLQQSSSQRSNLALVNRGDASDSIALNVIYFDGTGAALGTPTAVTLAPGQWTQFDQPLQTLGASSGFAIIEKTSGKSRFVAYGVLNDAVTSDGSYIPMSF